MTRFLRRTLFLAVLLGSATQARAGVSYDESPVFSFDTRDYLAGLAAESAVFTFDTRAVDGLQGAAVSGSFAFDTRGATLPPLQIAGVLRDSAGVPVVGATIQIKRAGAIFWQGVSGAGGAFTTPNLSGVNYTVIVTKPGYVTSITNITGTTGGSLALSLKVAPMPGVLNLQDVVRDIASGALRLTDAGRLRIFNGTQFVDVTGPLDPNRMTVVLSHGWKSGTGTWVTSLAQQISTHHTLGAQAPQIVAWDWQIQANRPLTGAIDVACEQGESLGKALRQRLGDGYSQRLHFIGHSFGTIVNCYACDYVHGNFSRPSNNPPTRWLTAQTKPHVTMLDEAEVATVFGETVVTSASIGWKAAQLQGALIAGTAAAVADWKSPVPKNAWWIDNYISMVGLQRDEAVNVCLPAYAIAFLSPIDAHGYAIQWYLNSISPPGAPPPVGFGSAYESGAAFPPSGTGQTAGNLWYENLATNDPLDLNLDPNPTAFEANIGILSAYSIQAGATVGNSLIYQPLDAVGRSVLNGYGTTVQWAGNVGGTVIYKTGVVVSETTEKVGLWWDAASDAASDVLNSVNPEALLANPLAASVFKIRLQTQAAPGPLAGNKGPASFVGQPAYAWVTVAVPADAGLMAFDFTVTGDPQEDRIACAINDQNVFMLPAKFAPDGQPVSTDMIDVSAYAGQSIELFFGLAGGTSTNCEVAIDGLRFITVPPPKIALAPAGANVAIKWPAAASGWVLESSETLAPASWQTVSTASGVTVESGVATLEELMSAPQKFYRLRRAP